MHNYPKNYKFLDHNLKLHEMIDIHSKYDNMHTNGIFNALIYINYPVNSCINCILSIFIKFFERNSMAYGRWSMACGFEVVFGLVQQLKVERPLSRIELMGFKNIIQKK